MASATVTTEPSAPPPAQLHLPQHHDVAAAWPLYSPSASLTCKRGSGEQQSRLSDIPLLPRGDDVQHHQNGYNNDDYSHKKNEDLVEEIHQGGGGGGKSLPQREKDDEEDRGRRDVGAQEVVVCLRENKLKAESDLELLHTSRGTPIPTRRKKAAASSSSSAASSSPPSSLGKYSTHINILSSNSIMTTTDGPTDLKQKQYQQFMAMAQVMKGDSFDTMEEISPPTSPRFLSLSTGSGMMGIKNQQQRYHNHISNNSRNLIEGSSGAASPSFSKSQSRQPLRSSPPVSTSATSSSPSLFGLLRQRQNILFLVFIVCITSSIILLTASYSPSFNLSFRSSSPRRVPRPDEIDDTWFLERDRLRGRIKDNFEVDPLTEHRTLLHASDDEDYPDVPVDESYKYRDYPFLLHNALPRVAQNGTVIMVIANSGYLEFLLNWKSYVDKQGITNYVIIPSDVQMAQQLSYLGVDWAYDPEIGMDALSQSVSYTMNKGTRAWANWNKVVHKKSHYFKKIVEMGYSVMVSDIDMVWLKNPFSRMNDSDVDIFFTNDGGAHGRDSSICGGLFYGKNREKSLAFINHVIECETTQEKKEQYCMNKWLGAVSGKSNANAPVPETPNYKIMSIDDFPSGGYFFGDKWAGKELPYVVHNNWIVGKANKLKRFKVFGYWRVDDSSLSNLMINFRFDEHRGKPGRGREGEIADELMVYHTEMRKKFGKFDDGVWLLEKPPVPKMRAPAELQRAKKTTTSTAAAAAVTSTAKKPKTETSGPVKAGPPRKVLPPKREAARNPNYKFIDGNRNPHYSGQR